MRKALAGWNRFWFVPQSSSTAAAVRIAGGLVLLATTASLGRDILSFFGPDGILPRQPDFKTAGLKGIWSVLGTSPSPAFVIGIYVASLLAALCLVVGFHSRLAALVVFICLVSFTRRNPTVFNSGDALLRVLSFYLLLIPGGAALSVDRWRRVRKESGEFWAFPARAVWPLRLMQIQLSVAYLTAVWAKVGGGTWREGSAVTYALRIGFIRRLPIPDAVTQSLLLSNVLTYATVATELALGLLVWNRRLRPKVLLLGVAFHLALDYAFRVGFFSYGMFVLYLAFIPPETMDAWLGAGRDRLARRRARSGTQDADAEAGAAGLRLEGDPAPDCVPAAAEPATLVDPSPGPTRI